MAKTDRILITGGSGFLGVALAESLLQRQPDRELVLTDIFRHPRLDTVADRVTYVEADLTDPDACRSLITADIGTVFHFASLVSGGAERDFAAGLAANVQAPMNMLEACRKQGRASRSATGEPPTLFVFPSSIATFGGRRLPDEVDDDTHQHPQNSYGVAKLVIEQLLNDYSRKGYIDGRGIRLPAIIVRDEPNSAASGYVSAIIREPVNGRDYVCPVTPETRIPVLSITKCIEALIDLSALEPDSLGDYRTVNGPGLSPSAAEIADAVANCGAASGDIRFEPEQAVIDVITSWPKVMRADRAQALGLRPDESIEAIVDEYRELTEK
jgi:nucleoside-diphosphate-sugar epimerase